MGVSRSRAFRSPPLQACSSVLTSSPAEVLVFISPSSGQRDEHSRRQNCTNVPLPTSVDQGAGTEVSRPVHGCLLLAGAVAVVQTIAGMALREATLLAMVAALLFLPAGRWNW